MGKMENDNFEQQLDQVAEAIKGADAVFVGVGSGLSTAAGLAYTGPRFDDNFADFKERFGIRDMYSGGFYPFPDLETHWAWWSRHIYLNRYDLQPAQPYVDLLCALAGKDYFALTTNVDHQFQLAGFDKQRLFYTQGDYGLFQCSRPCCQETWDNEDAVRAMLAQQADLRIPTELLPTCPHCGAPATVNLRADDTFVQDAGWYAANQRYQQFKQRHQGMRAVLLELGVGYNTPVIIKYPFWQMANANPQAQHVCIDWGDVRVPRELEGKSIGIRADLAQAMAGLAERLG